MEFMSLFLCPTQGASPNRCFQFPKHQRATIEISSISGIRESARQLSLKINYNR